MTPTAVAFGNLGRGTPEQTRVAVDRIAKHMGQFPVAALLLNEVDEADTADEHGLLSASFRSWEDHAWESREPILLKGIEARRPGRSIRAARGVVRQSPARPIHEVIVRNDDGPDTVFIGGHFPAGAKNGQRPALARIALVTEYARMLRLLRKRIRHHHRKGRHVVWAMDVNWRLMPRLHRREGVLARRGPDTVRVIPAKGWEAHRPRHGDVDLGIEALHRLLWAVVRFERVKPPAESTKE